MNWYALFVETGQEETVKKLLHLHFDESTLSAFVPKRRVPEKKLGKIYHVLKKMFPGYVLIKTKMNADLFYKIKKIPKCYRILGNRTHHSKDDEAYYSTIDEEEISPILKLIGNDEVVDYSKIYVENSRVFVQSGPLKGMEGIIKKVDKRKKRAKILLNFMGTEKMIDVGVEIIAKSNS
ncbi:MULTISPECIES: antiterminator LoaP [unclassified Thermoactinomyces]|jgi:transcription termination/antitermination protein NusG|uniref:antiterminator LoaP n=1 Tax=unclassified Thermoactinomyces TaxID=2634588 RepID=UPI0018DE76B5|nr:MULTISPECIES: antiterminator LoaP [unclassified Thermoactinomyces]MBH8598733.1 antiterminator LoaP [Thermoactinomyces sp. CICC 10523]MBH8605515.1 antiterminator LoaP [Thermoactinomyces sp. CICC 10522]MBH8608797.1 antiterminator LoaP [Thermoactinomyces sp. CICC 10521]